MLLHLQCAGLLFAEFITFVVSFVYFSFSLQYAFSVSKREAINGKRFACFTRH